MSSSTNALVAFSALLLYVGYLRKRRSKNASFSKQQVWKLRQKLFSPNQTVSYSNTEPLMIVKGRGQYLIDEQGTKWLDTRNNVGHVGWQDPTVTQAVIQQIQLTNSNTRYLHPKQVLLAQKLLETFPDGCKLRDGGACFFVNSGSEANELALRLARAHTKATESIVVERGYHGSTNATVCLSDYKFNGKGGRGCPDWVHVVPCPDTYRVTAGAVEGSLAEHYSGFVEHVCSDLSKAKKEICCFIMESGMSVAGVILPPPGYLKRVYSCVRKHGGVCIADEVQTGLGRFGKYFWGFEQQSVVPDIVTVGKPFGNGFPLAAVVCTREVMNSFNNGMEYFSTFGGNPVACAAGLAVLEVLDRDSLLKHATTVGNYLLKRLLQLRDSTAEGKLIGDVRGCGLFQGIEFVLDKDTKLPATKETSAIVTSLLRKHHILTSVDGPHNNVLVFKPPMRFSKQNIDRFVAALQESIRGLKDIDLASLSFTPT